MAKKKTKTDYPTTFPRITKELLGTCAYGTLVAIETSNKRWAAGIKSMFAKQLDGGGEVVNA